MFLLLTISCNKETDKFVAHSSTESFSVTEAKNWFQENEPAVKEAFNPLERKIDPNHFFLQNRKFFPSWLKALNTNDPNYYIVDCPVHMDSVLGLTRIKKGEQSLHPTPNAITRLLILKNKKTGKIRSAIMFIHFDELTDKHINYAQRKHYSGSILYTTMAGKLINGWVYENGKVTKKISNPPKKNKDISRINPLALEDPGDYGVMDCHTEYMPIYERYCSYNTGTGDIVSCTMWQYSYSLALEVCVEGDTNGEVPFEGNPGGYIEHDEPYPPATADWDSQITDSLTHDCLIAIWNKIKNLNTGKVSDIIYKLSGTSPGYNWKIKEGNLPPNHWGSTDPIYSNGFITTTFDYNKLKNATDLAAAVTIMHESVHAYLTAFFNSDRILANKTYPEMLDEWIKEKHPDLNQVQHNQMVISFKQDISDALKEYGESCGYNLNSQLYDDMAWSGLQFTSAFSNLSDNDQVRIQNRLSAELTDSDFSDETSSGTKACQ